MDGQSNPWDRQPGEPNRWYQRFERYRLLGPDRSLLAAYNAERVGKSRRESRHASGSWRSAAKTWRWIERAEAFDEAERKRLEAEWERRMEEQRQREWELGVALQAKAKEALAEAKVPAKVIPTMAATGSKLARLATGQPTERVEVDDVSLTDEERAARIAALLDAARARRAGQPDRGPDGG